MMTRNIVVIPEDVLLFRDHSQYQSTLRADNVDSNQTPLQSTKHSLFLIEESKLTRVWGLT